MAGGVNSAGGISVYGLNDPALLAAMAACCCPEGGSGHGSGSGSGSGDTGSQVGTCCSCPGNTVWPSTIHVTLQVSCLGTFTIDALSTSTPAVCEGEWYGITSIIGDEIAKTGVGCNGAGISSFDPATENVIVKIFCVKCYNTGEQHWYMQFYWYRDSDGTYREADVGGAVSSETPNGSFLFPLTLVSCNPLIFTASGTVNCNFTATPFTCTDFHGFDRGWSTVDKARTIYQSCNGATFQFDASE